MIIAAVLLTLAAGRAPAPDTAVRAELACGAGRFRLVSRTVPGADAPVSPTSQALTVEVAGRTRALRVPAQGRVRLSGRRVQRAYVQSWACLQGPGRTRYVQLGYACAAEPGGRGACAGGDEWAALLDDHGRMVDTGLPNGGPLTPALRARERLERRLGLSEVLAKGVAHRSVLGLP